MICSYSQNQNQNQNQNHAQEKQKVNTRNQYSPQLLGQRDWNFHIIKNLKEFKLLVEVVQNNVTYYYWDNKLEYFVGRSGWSYTWQGSFYPCN